MLIRLLLCLTPAALCAQTILETSFQNPPYQTKSDSWAKQVCHGQPYFANEFPPYEWMQVLAPASETDEHVVGISGVAIQPEVAANDVPFTHPFGLDWEFFLAPDAAFRYLLAPSNLGPDSEFVEATRRSAALGFAVPSGVLGVETDADLVPKPYRAMEGDRIVLFGRWIVDCGHADFHAEIHPPLLLVSARAVDKGKATTVSVISRPWLVGQRFTVDDEPIRKHLLNEVVKLETLRSMRVEAHPKILKPFAGVQRLTYIVRPPNPRPSPKARLQASFHFTVRRGVSVEVSDGGTEAVTVAIIMDAAAYHEARLPRRKDWDVPIAMINQHTEVINRLQILNSFAHPVAGLLLSRDWLTDRYEAPQAPEPGTKPVTVNDDQPFPIYGQMRVEWQRY